MLFTALFPVRVLRHLDLLDLRSQLFQCAVAVHSVRNVIPETVAQYALAVCLPDAVSLTDAAEGMAGRSGAFHYKSLLDFYLKICIIKSRNSLLPYICLRRNLNMAGTAFVNDARVMSKGQVTIPKNVRAALGIESGDRVTFIVDGNNVRVVNSAVYALMRFQEQMGGEAEKAGLFTEDDVANWITQSRREEATE